MDAELEFAIQSSTTGKQLFDQVCFEVSYDLRITLRFQISVACGVLN